MLALQVPKNLAQSRWEMESAFAYVYRVTLVMFLNSPPSVGTGLAIEFSTRQRQVPWRKMKIPFF